MIICAATLAQKVFRSDLAARDIGVTVEACAPWDLLGWLYSSVMKEFKMMCTGQK